MGSRVASLPPARDCGRVQSTAEEIANGHVGLGPQSHSDL